MFLKIERLQECGILSEKDVNELKESGFNEVWSCEEVLQDFTALTKATWAVKTPEPTDEEIAEWEAVFKQMTTSDYPFRAFRPLFPYGISHVRTPDPTEEEIQDWQKLNEELINLDWDEARKCVQFVERDASGGWKPYQSDSCYCPIFYNNETLKATSVVQNFVRYKTHHENVIPGSMVGTIYHGTTPVQIFKIHENCKGTLTKIWNHDLLAEMVCLDRDEVVIRWNKEAPTDTYVFASYEANVYVDLWMED